MTGLAFSGLPTTPGAFQTALGDTMGCGPNCGDAFVTKLDAAGTALVYSTFLGGNESDQGNGIAVDAGGKAYIAGQTNSTNFPVTPSAFQSKLVGGSCVGRANFTCMDAFVAVLNSTGTALIYSTYLGGSGDDIANAIAVDPSAKAYVTGSTTHADFPTTPGSFKTAFSGAGAVFVSKIDPTLSGNASLVYSTFLGGSQPTSAFPDKGNGIAVNASGEAFITGAAVSGNMATPGAFQTTGGGSAFVARFNSSGSALVYSTYLGGSKLNPAGCGNQAEFANAIAIDSADDAYVTGNAQTADFPTTIGAFQRTINGNDDAFVTKLNAQGTALIYSTLLGGSATGQDDATFGPCGAFELGTGIAVDSAGNAYVAGNTFSRDFPLTPVTLQTECTNPTGGSLPQFGTCSAFATVLNPAGTKLVFSSLLGGHADFLNLAFSRTSGIAVDPSGNMYIVGLDATQFPTVPAFPPNGPGPVGNGLIAKISLSGTAPAVSLSANELAFNSQAVGTTSPPQSVTLTNRGNGPLNVSGITTTGNFAQTNTCSPPLAPGSTCTIGVTFTPTVQGFAGGTLSVADDAFNSPQFVILSGGGGTPFVSLSVSSLTFSSQGIGTTSAPQTVMVTNTGSANLSITSIATMGDFAETNNCGSALGVALSCAISVTFTPAATGSRSGTLSITDNTSDSPQKILLGGTGSILALSASSLAFANQPIDTNSQAQTVMVNNKASSGLSITGVSTTGDFSETDNCGSSLPAGASCAVHVTFAPTITGSRAGTLTVAYSASGSPAIIPLSGAGIGVGFGLQAAPPSATVAAGHNTNYSLTVTPAGGFNQSVSLTCTGAPTNATCTVSPASVSFNGANPAAATVNVTTIARGTGIPKPHHHFFLPPTSARDVIPALLVLLVLVVLIKSVGTDRRLAWNSAAAMILLLALTCASCGGGSGGGSGSGGSAGTQAGTYNLTVTGTSGSTTTQATLTLVVK